MREMAALQLSVFSKLAVAVHTVLSNWQSTLPQNMA
jgi:hypothetical protein